MFAGGLLIVIGQLLALNKSGLQPSDWQAATFLALATALLIVLPGLWPLTFERHRHAIVALARVVLFAQPITRNPRGMQYVFQVRRCWAAQQGGRLRTALGQAAGVQAPRCEP